MSRNESTVEFVKMIHANERIIYKVVSFYENIDQSKEDLYQEVVLNLWKAYPSFRGESKQSTWIYRIALNTCITFFRRFKNKPFQTELNFDIPIPSDDSDSIQSLYNMINTLGKVEKALVLLFLEDRPYKEIAEITGLSVTNVATKLSRIKEKLKRMSNQF